MMMLTKEHFAQAAELLESHGWVTHYYGNRETTFCAYSALTTAAGGDKYESQGGCVQLIDNDLVRDFLRSQGVDAPDDCVTDWRLCSWNNTQFNKWAVIDAFKKFATT